MFMLVSRRYERLDDRPLQQAVSGWGEIFGDDIVAAAMIDRLVHHAEIVALKKATATATATATSPAHQPLEAPKRPDRSLRRPRRGPQNADTRPGLSANAPADPPEQHSQALRAPEPDRLRRPASPQEITDQGGAFSTGAKGVHLQPALTSLASQGGSVEQRSLRPA